MGGRADYVTREEMERTIARIVEGVVVAVVWSCAKNWLPGYSAHVGRTAGCIGYMGEETDDKDVGRVLVKISAGLEYLRPANEDTSDTVIRLSPH